MIPTYFPEKFKKMIAHWDDERKSGNALIISLKDGWHHPTSEAHVFGVDSIKEALSVRKLPNQYKCRRVKIHTGMA